MGTCMMEISDNIYVSIGWRRQVFYCIGQVILYHLIVFFVITGIHDMYVIGGVSMSVDNFFWYILMLSTCVRSLVADILHQF